MSAYRNGLGQIKRTAETRDFRRAHLQGAHNMVLKGEKTPDDFKGRVRAILNRIFR